MKGSGKKYVTRAFLFGILHIYILYSIDVPISYIFIILSYKYPLERDTHVSLLISMGFSAVSIGNRVGHESVDITFRYAHMFPTEQIQMAELLNAEFKEGTEE